MKKRGENEVDKLFHTSEFAAWSSWSFCPACGRRRADGKLSPDWHKKGRALVERKCNGGCDHGPQELCVDQVSDDDKRNDDDDEVYNECAQSKRPYITPRIDRPPNEVPVDDAAGPVVEPVPYGPKGEHAWSAMYGEGGLGDWPSQILKLSTKEAEALSVITLKVQHTRVRGGHAPTSNLKKTGVVTAHWRRTDVTAGITQKCRLAFDWLMEYNPTYKRFVEQHRKLLGVRASDRAKDWFVIKTVQLLMQMPGVEVAQHGLGCIRLQNLQTLISKVDCCT